MKTKMKRMISILVTLMLLSSFAFTVEAEDTYDHIGFDYMQSAYAKGDTEYLTVTAYDADNDEVTFEEDLTYTSSNENVVTVDANGLMTAVDYGVATVTATYGGKTASMLVTVTNNTINANEGGAAPSSHSTDLVRNGSYSYKLQGGTDTSFSDGTYAKINSLLHPWNTIPANAVINAWFYDNGASSNSEAGVYMSPYSNNANGTRAVGILNESDTTYKVSEKGARLSQTNNNWNQGNKYGIRSDVIGSATNTGIQRTKGWHQVAFVRKNADASATMTDSGSAFPKSTVYKIYLDGQEVYTETADRAFVYLYGYAGYNSSNYAYIADPSIHSYIGLDDVALTENSGTFTLGYNYYGASGTQTPSYKWQVSDDGATGWTDIAGETNQTFSPSVDYQNKSIRGGVKVATSGVETGYQFSEAESIVIFDGTYDSISLGKNAASLTKGATDTLSLIGYRYGHEFAVSDLSGAVFTSNNEGVVTVTNAGVVTAVDYGVATVTATYGGMTASLLVTVTNSTTINAAEGGAAPSSHSTDLVRSGSYSFKLQGGTDTSFSDGNYATINSLVHVWNTIPANAVINAWFYDNGQSTDSEAGIYMSPYSNNANGTRAVGILNASDTTYKVSERGARLSQTNNNWNQGNKYGITSAVIGTATNTGIQRTVGWHQVSFVRKNTDASATMSDSGSAFPKSTVYKIYLDGQEVYTETADRAFAYLYGYAGFNSSNYAYIADPSIHQYIDAEVTIAEDNGTFTAAYSYYGTTGTKTPSYKWQVSSDGVAGWADISGATGQTFTPSGTYQNKYIRCGVKVSTANAQMDSYRFSEPKNFFQFDGTYDSISLGKNTASFTKGATGTLSLIGYRYGHEFTVSDLSGAVFSSNNEGVVTVTNAGVVTAVDYGVATVTATYGGVAASMLIHVTNDTSVNAAEGGAGASGHSTDLVRNGAYSYKLQGGTDTSFSDAEYAKINSVLHQWNTIPANAVINMWFYDNGLTSGSEAAIYASAYNMDANGTKAVGIIDSSDTTYKLTGKGTRRSQTGGNWNEGNKVGVNTSVSDMLEDTGIQRTIGWHQVTFVRKNTDASATVTDKGNSFPKSTACDIYLDGQLVDRETGKDRAFVYLYAYAGFDSGNYAYVADPSIYSYIDTEVSVTESNGTYTANYSYYGTASAQTPSYKWQVSDDGLTGWTDISGATGQTYTPTASVRGKHIRAAVSVAAGDASVGWHYSKSLEVETSLAYRNGSVYINSAQDIDDAVLIIAEYQTVGSFVKLVSARFIDNVDVTANVEKTVSTGIIAPASGNTVKIMLWDSLSIQRALSSAITIQ